MKQARVAEVTDYVEVIKMAIVLDLHVIILRAPPNWSFDESVYPVTLPLPPASWKTIGANENFVAMIITTEKQKSVLLWLTLVFATSSTVFI